MALKVVVKKKAESLVLSFIHVPDSAIPIDSNKAWIDKLLAIRCAIICVKGIIKAIGKCNCGHLSGNQYAFYTEVKEALEEMQS